jgi:hypothetical protein
MDSKSGYSDCELRYIDQGYELEYTAEPCAGAEDRASDQETEKSKHGKVQIEKRKN